MEKTLNERLAEIEGILKSAIITSSDDEFSEEFNNIRNELEGYLKTSTDKEIVVKIEGLLEKHLEILKKLLPDLLKNQNVTLDKLKKDYDKMKKENPELYISILENKPPDTP